MEETQDIEETQEIEKWFAINDTKVEYLMAADAMHRLIP